MIGPEDDAVPMASHSGNRQIGHDGFPFLPVNIQFRFYRVETKLPHGRIGFDLRCQYLRKLLQNAPVRIESEVEAGDYGMVAGKVEKVESET